MTFKLSTGRKALSALVVAAVVGVALSPASAFAKDKHGHGGHGGHGGRNAAIFGGAVLLGALVGAAADASDGFEERECWTERRKRFDAYGDMYVVKVRVCD